MSLNFPPLILASTASWRADLLRRKHPIFETMAPPYEEHFPRDVTPRELAIQHAEGKAHASAQVRPTAYILAADQTAEFQGVCLQKPPDIQSCIAQLSRLQGATHYLHSATALYSPIHRKVKSRVVTVTLTMKALSDEEVSNYVHQDRPIGCVGAYKFECGGKQLFAHIDQDESAIVGLPLQAVDELLKGSHLMGQEA